LSEKLLFYFILNENKVSTELESETWYGAP